MKRLQVAVGILSNSEGEVLVGQRTVKDRYFQQWEFPGGKLEPGESAEQALQRELQEELGILVEIAEPLFQHAHDYPDRHVDLFIYRVLDYSGAPHGRENQALKWLRPEQLEDIDFLEGNREIVRRVRAIDFRPT